MEEQSYFKDLSKFTYKRVLSDNIQRKVICVEGSFENGKPSILVLEKKAFTEENVKNICTPSSVLEKQFVNDIYGSYECFPEVQLNGIKTTIIHPATEDHIKKFEKQPFHIIEETKELYDTITIPYITKQQLSLKWVYNILDHDAEADRIIYNDPDVETGFVLLPDLKWDGKQIETLYLLAICRKKEIKSLRDLNKGHLQLLQNILSRGIKIIQEKYKVEKSKLRIYVHYQPSFYHFHVHFTHLDFEAPGTTCDRAHLLTTVIDNIKRNGDYYQIFMLPFLIKESDGLFQQYFKKGIVEKFTPVTKELDGTFTTETNE